MSWTMGRISMPGVSMRMSRKEMPLCLGASRSVRASTKHQSLQCASDVHTFWPSITHWSRPSESVATTALVATLARSDPASGSE